MLSSAHADIILVAYIAPTLVNKHIYMATSYFCYKNEDRMIHDSHGWF